MRIKLYSCEFLVQQQNPGAIFVENFVFTSYLTMILIQILQKNYWIGNLTEVQLSDVQTKLEAKDAELREQKTKFKTYMEKSRTVSVFSFCCS